MTNKATKCMIFFLLTLLFVTGCGVGTAKEVVSEREGSMPKKDSQSIVAGNFDPSVTVEVINGKPKVTFTVKNQTEHVKEFTFNSGKKFDFIIYDASGNKVYQWSDDRMFIQMIETVSLKQGEVLTFTEVADVELPAGEYMVEAWLAAQDTDIKAKTTFNK